VLSVRVISRLTHNWQVNPATAYNMLSDFVDLKEGDWVIQNGANSSVGSSLIQQSSANLLHINSSP
jgi:NADPH-dependent curcumin reductase CurA